MNVYVCRWPNGNFSAVHADSMRAAMSLLDGVESVSPTRLVKVDDFVVHFNLRLPKCDCESVPEFEVVSFGQTVGPWPIGLRCIGLILSRMNYRR
jgi:hypothetical protein